ncbi:hypothetical protein [Streptomyces sp. SP17BM10]|uniref:hypothetical protein n=1 Tax=Streptomyces sp. SP17BM10 TaxID=3002530 RepID=UPI002E75E201|nr:hypothetical protein [Streptomyces sp. SP17BM10]
MAAKPSVMKRASISAISDVPRMNPAIGSNARSAQAATVSPPRPGRKERIESPVRWPSRRKKNIGASADARR